MFSYPEVKRQKNILSIYVGHEKVVTRCEQNSKNKMYFILPRFVSILYVDVFRERYQYLKFQWGWVNYKL